MMGGEGNTPIQKTIVIEPTPLEKMLETLWAAPSSRMSSKAQLAATLEFCATEYGLIDRLTPGTVVLRHNDPKTPGELRVKLAAAQIVRVLIFFQEAPRIKVSVDVPLKQWKTGMERQIAPQYLPAVFQVLVQRAAQALAEEQKQQKPKILLPE